MCCYEVHKVFFLHQQLLFAAKPVPSSVLWNPKPSYELRLCEIGGETF